MDGNGLEQYANIDWVCKTPYSHFYRVDFDRNKSSGGNGLGLYIVQQILKMYNLDYSFKSILTGMSFEVNFNNEIVRESQGY